MKQLTIALAIALAGCATGPAYMDSPKLRTCQYQATALTTGGHLLRCQRRHRRGLRRGHGLPQDSGRLHGAVEVAKESK